MKSVFHLRKVICKLVRLYATWSGITSAEPRTLALFWAPRHFPAEFNVDDWGRSVMGYLNWGLDGRPLTDFIVAALDIGRPLVDFSPISQIGSILCLSWLSAIVARRFTIKGPFLAALVTLPFGANPFFFGQLILQIRFATDDAFPGVRPSACRDGWAILET